MQNHVKKYYLQFPLSMIQSVLKRVTYQSCTGDSQQD